MSKLPKRLHGVQDALDFSREVYGSYTEFLMTQITMQKGYEAMQVNYHTMYEEYVKMEQKSADLDARNQALIEKLWVLEGRVKEQEASQATMDGRVKELAQKHDAAEAELRQLHIEAREQRIENSQLRTENCRLRMEVGQLRGGGC